MLFKIAVFAVAGIVLLLLLKRNAPTFAIIGEITVVAITVLAVMPEIENLLSLLVQVLQWVNQQICLVLMNWPI